MTRDPEQTVRLLARALVHTGEVLAHLTHPHLERELRDSFEALIREAVGGMDDTSAFIARLRRVRACLEDIGLVSGAPLARLLLAERHILLLELDLGTERIHAPARTTQQRPATASPKTNRPLVGSTRESLEQVLSFVLASGPVQARDIIAGCGPKLSERTVKRRISDLVRSGHLRKEEQGGLLLYTANP